MSADPSVGATAVKAGVPDLRLGQLVKVTSS
jgi:hypothetical protein